MVPEGASVLVSVVAAVVVFVADQIPEEVSRAASIPGVAVVVETVLERVPEEASPEALIPVAAAAVQQVERWPR